MSNTTLNPLAVHIIIIVPFSPAPYGGWAVRLWRAERAGFGYITGFCVNPVEIEPSDVTDFYHGLHGPDNVSTA